jgi:phosphopantetheinyl transferase
MEEAQQAQQKLQEAFAKADGEGIYWRLFEIHLSV